jgi:3-isopropylmalate dehydrogenase
VLADSGVIKPETRHDVDVVVVREVSGGMYLGQWDESGSGEERVATHRSSYTEDCARRLLHIACELAHARRKRLAVVLKPNGLPSVSRLWMDVAAEIERARDIEVDFLEVDNACFQLIQTARNFDVVAAPNMFGDIVNDVMALLLGSKGTSFSGNYGPDGASVYDTGHGPVHAIAGQDQASPLAQIGALSMALDIHYDLRWLAQMIQQAVETTLRQGWRTRTLAAAGCTVVGTKELTRRIVRSLEQLKRGPLSGA